LDQKNIPFDIVMTKIDKATQKSLSLHTRLLKQKLADFIIHMPKIFMISNVSKKGREQLLEYIETLM
jgi:GTP-binding protein EngB required for normal cell division